MKTFGEAEAQDRFDELLKAVEETGARFSISRNGRVVAWLEPWREDRNSTSVPSKQQP